MKRRILIDLLLLALFGALAYYALQFYPLAVRRLVEKDYEILSPKMFAVLLVIPLFWLMAVHTLSDLPWYQRLLSVLLKTALVVAVALSAVEISKVERTSKKVAVVYLVDVSDSIPDDVLTRVHAHLQSVWSQRKQHRMRVITFAGEARVMVLKADAKTLPKLARLPRGNRTNIQRALRLGYGLFPDGYLKRMVIISDGNETEGNLMAELENAASMGIRTSYKTFKSSVTRKEMLVKGVEVDDVKVGVPFSVTGKLVATAKTRASCSLFREDIGMSAGKKELTLVPGENKVVFKGLQVTEGGEIRFRLSCTASKGDDKIKENNVFYRAVTVDSKPKILYVEGDYKHRQYMLKALHNEHFHVDAVPHYGLPNTLAEMRKYDLILISDVPAIRMSHHKQQLLERYVRSHHGGLIITGGQDSLGPGGYTGTILEKLIPVRLDVKGKKQSPSVALMLVIDRSGSMNGRNMELAKEAAKATANVLSGDSKIGVIVFDTQARRIVPLQSAAYKGRIQRLIASIRAGGGTDIEPALRMAFEDLENVNAKVKHIILLSDGKAPHRQIPQLVQEMRDKNITVSTVGVGNYVDRGLLTQIAELGGGRSYFTNDAYSLPKIFLNETTKRTRQSLVEEPLRAMVNPRFLRAQILRGIDMRHAPFLLGYVVTRPKPRAEVILYMERYKEPLLARWRQGLGKVVVFTSDVKSRWSPYWLRWRQYAKFWGQVIRDTMRSKKMHQYQMTAEIVKGTLRVKVNAVSDGGKFVNNLKSIVKVHLPEAKAPKGTPQKPKTPPLTVSLKQLASGYYEATVPLAKFGPYRLVAEHRDGEGKLVATSKTDVSYPYPLEYLIVNPNTDLLKTAVTLTGGYHEAPLQQLFDPGKDKAISRSKNWPFFIYFAIFLFLLDLVLRRVRLGSAATVSWRGQPRKSRG